MAKRKVSREMVIDAAFELARKGGLEAAGVREVAKELNCSVQPIYYYFENIEGLRQEVIRKTDQFAADFARSRIDPADPFASMGRAHVCFAREEPQLFSIYILHQRQGIHSLKDFYQNQANGEMAQVIAESLQISLEKARMLHLQMLVYTIGLGTIFSVCQPGLEAEEVFSLQQSAFDAFLAQANGDGQKGADRKEEMK